MSDTIVGLINDLNAMKSSIQKRIDAAERLALCVTTLRDRGAVVDVSITYDNLIKLRVELPGFTELPVAVPPADRAEPYRPGERQAIAELPYVSPEVTTGAPDEAAEGEGGGASDAPANIPVDTGTITNPSIDLHDEPLPAAPPVNRTGASWSLEEDADIIETIAANRVSRELGYTAVMEQIGARLGRTASSVQTRASGALKGKILQREVELRRAMPQEIPAGPPATEPVRTESVSEGPEDAEGATPTPVEVSEAAVAGADSPPYTVAIVPPAPPFQTGQPLWWREIEDRLNRIGNAAPFTPAIDVALLESLAKGHKLGWVSTDLGIDFGTLKQRFARLVPEPGIAAQDKVLQVLRARADRKAA